MTAAAPDDPWTGLRKELFGERTVLVNDGAFALYAPDTAEDAAIVPVTVRIPAKIANEVTSLVLLVDRNPSPVAATFHFKPAFRTASGNGERMISTRLRVDSFAHVRAVLETSDGQLHMAAKFVAGAGGCSSPGAKDPDEAIANLGAVSVKAIAYANREPMWREGVVMIRHPNFTGMQMNGKTGKFTPARFVSAIEVKRDSEPLFSVDTGISIAENPHIRFSYEAAPADTLEVDAVDTAGTTFTGSSAASGS